MFLEVCGMIMVACLTVIVVIGTGMLVYTVVSGFVDDYQGGREG